MASSLSTLGVLVSTLPFSDREISGKLLGRFDNLSLKSSSFKSIILQNGAPSNCRFPIRGSPRSLVRASSQKNETDVIDDDRISSLPAEAETRSIVMDLQENKKRQAESTDFVATTLTRRFGIGAGLAWVGFLAFGVVSEQIKTRLEVYNEEQNTKDVVESEEVSLPDGIRYTDLRVGGGSNPRPGDLVLVALTGRVQGDSNAPFVDTAAPGARELVYAFWARPLVGGVTPGLEATMKSMRVGGKRRVIVPPELGFGPQGEDLGQGRIIPPNSTLEYVVELKRASIAPS